jgi:hypothetical protein
MDLYGRGLVDIAIDLINGYLLCGQVSSKVDMDVAVSVQDGKDNGQTISMKKRKAMIAHRYITKNTSKITALTELICSGDKSTFIEYSNLVGPIKAE